MSCLVGMRIAGWKNVWSLLTATLPISSQYLLLSAQIERLSWVGLGCEETYTLTAKYPFLGYLGRPSQTIVFIGSNWQHFQCREFTRCRRRLEFKNVTLVPPKRTSVSISSTRRFQLVALSMAATTIFLHRLAKIELRDGQQWSTDSFERRSLALCQSVEPVSNCSWFDRQCTSNIYSTKWRCTGRWQCKETTSICW